MNGKIVMIFLFAVFATGCSLVSSDIDDIKNEETIGEDVMIAGNVTASVKIGELSGFVVDDGTAQIAVSSGSLPEVGERVIVRGTLLRDPVFGYYIEANSWD